MNSRSVMLGLCLLVVAHSAAAREKAAYDLDGNGLIETMEYARYVLDLYSPPLSEFDANLDGKIAGEEQDAASRALSALGQQVSPCVDDFTVVHASGQPLAEFAAQRETCLLRDEEFFEGDFPERIMVRSSTEDLILFRPESEDVKRGAMFSFAYDLRRSANIASVKGALMRPINLSRGEDDEESVRYLVPSLSVNLMSDDSGRNKNVDTLAFRLAYETGFSTPAMNWARIGVSPVFTTDTNFDLDVRGADIQFEPTLLGGGMGAARTLGPLRFRWRGFFQGEYSRVFATEDRAKLEEGEYSARAGGKLAMRLWPEGLFPGGLGRRLQLNMEYLFMKELQGGLDDREYFEAAISYALDPRGHFRLQTKYVNGSATQALENEESWTIGLGVLY